MNDGEHRHRWPTNAERRARRARDRADNPERNTTDPRAHNPRDEHDELRGTGRAGADVDHRADAPRDVIPRGVETDRDVNAPRRRVRQPVLVASPQHGELIGTLTNLARTVERMAPRVLSTSTIMLDVNGQATRSYRTPFAAVAITSGSLNQLVIASGGGSGTTPGPGDGAAQIPVLGFAAINLTGYQWTITGGNPGDLVTVQTFGRPIHPVVASGSVNIGNQVTVTQLGKTSVSNFGTATGPAGSATIVSLGALNAGSWLCEWQISFNTSGAVAAAESNNMALKVGATQILSAQIQPTAGTNPVPQPNVTVATPGGQTFAVVAKAAGTATAVYQAQLVATQVA